MCCADEVHQILGKIQQKNQKNEHWKRLPMVPLSSGESFNDIKKKLNYLMKNPFTTIEGKEPDFFELFCYLINLDEIENLNVSICTFEKNIMGIKIVLENDKILNIDMISKMLSKLTKCEVMLSDDESDYEGYVQIENGDIVISYIFDFTTFSINGYSIQDCENVLERKYSISLNTINENFLKNFHEFSLRMLISMTYIPHKSFNMNLGKEALLLNIPKSRSRILDLANILYPKSDIKLYEKEYYCDGINAEAFVQIVYIKFASSKNENQVDIKEKSKLLFFTFVNNFPVVENSYYAYGILSSIDWFELDTSLIPDPINNDKPYSFEKLPFCTYSSIYNRPGISLIISVKSTKESARALVVNAITYVFNIMNQDIGYQHKKKSSLRRLNSIWQSINIVTASITSILDEEQEFNSIWNGICHIEKKANSKKDNKDKANMIIEIEEPS